MKFRFYFHLAQQVKLPSILCLDDVGACTARICQREKSYYGSEQEIADNFQTLEAAEREPECVAAYRDFCGGDRQVRSPCLLWEKPFLEPVTVFAKRDFHCDKEFVWEHLNTWKYTYFLKADGYHSTHLWLKHGEQYLRCIRPRFPQLCRAYEESEEERVWRPVRESSWCWGNTEMLVFREEQDGRYSTSSRFYVTERYFDTEDALRADIISFDGAGEYRECGNEIFGDG